MDLTDAIDRHMGASGYSYEFAFTTAASDATRITRNAVDEKFDIVVAVGGDGTVNEVGSGLIRTETALGIIPLGSGNGVARSLNIPQTLADALDLLLTQSILEIDVGTLNGEYFIGIAGTGYDALIGNKFQTFGARGPLPYFFISLREYLKYQCHYYKLCFNDELFRIEALMVTFANTREYGNGAVIAPNADPQDGFIDICMITPQNIWGAIRASVMLFNNTIDKHPGFVTKKCRSLSVEAEGEEMYVHRDGEPDERKIILNVGILPKALRVCSPLGKRGIT